MEKKQITSSMATVLKRNMIIISTIILLGTNCTTNKINNYNDNDSICIDSCQDELVEKEIKPKKHADFSLLGVHLDDNEYEAIRIWENMGLEVHKTVPRRSNSKIDFLGAPVVKEIMWTSIDNTVSGIDLQTPFFNTEKEALHYYQILVPQIKDIANKYEKVKKIESESDDYKNFVEGTSNQYFYLKDVCYYDECFHAISVTLKVQLRDRTAAKYDSNFARTHWYVMISLFTLDEDFIRQKENAKQKSNKSATLDYDIIGKWELGSSNNLFVIYMKNNKYFGNNIDNGVLSDNEFELKKTMKNGRTIYIPVHIDSWSETYELRENGIYIKNVDGTGGQIFYNAK